MKTAHFIQVILPQTPVHLAQILGGYFIWVILTQELVHLAQILLRRLKIFGAFGVNSLRVAFALLTLGKAF